MEEEVSSHLTSLKKYNDLITNDPNERESPIQISWSDFQMKALQLDFSFSSLHVFEEGFCSVVLSNLILNFI